MNEREQEWNEERRGRGGGFAARVMVRMLYLPNALRPLERKATRTVSSRTAARRMAVVAILPLPAFPRSELGAAIAVFPWQMASCRWDVVGVPWPGTQVSLLLAACSS